MNLRNFDKDTPQYKFYEEQHERQTLDFVKSQHKKYKKLNNKVKSVKDMLLLMDTFIDPSDPDLDVPNSIHAYQTAERIRKKHPIDLELQVVGLIHDVGKVLFSLDEPNYSVVGDTFVVGCKFPESIVYYDTLKANEDFGMFSENGIYEENCGLDKLYISYGHDEYLYQVLAQNKNHKMSKRGMDIIRYHSFYPWHSEGEYEQFMNEKDCTTLENVQCFNQFDLYSKEDDAQISDEIKIYYDQLLELFFPEKLQW